MHDAVDYKALGSLPRMHETLIPFKQHVNTFFFVALQRGEKANAIGIIVTPGGFEGGGECRAKKLLAPPLQEILTHLLLNCYTKMSTNAA